MEIRLCIPAGRVAMVRTLRTALRCFNQLCFCSPCFSWSCSSSGRTPQILTAIDARVIDSQSDVSGSAFMGMGMSNLTATRLVATGGYQAVFITEGSSVCTQEQTTGEPGLK